MDEIPFVVTGRGPANDSVLYSVVPINREVLNKKSAKDSILYSQGFQQKFFFGCDPDEAHYLTERNAVFFSSREGRMAIAEPSDPAALERDIDNKTRDAILKGTIRVAQQHQLLTRQVNSAESKQEDNKAFIEYLTYVADKVQKGLNRVMYFLNWFETSKQPKKGEYEIELVKNFRAVPTDAEVTDETRLHGMLGEFGQPGRIAKAEIVATKILQKRLAADDKSSEEKLKKDLVQAIREEAQKEPVDPLAEIEKRLASKQQAASARLRRDDPE